MENNIFDVAAADVKGRRIQYEALKQWVTRKKKKIVSLRKQETDHTDSNMNSEQNEVNPKTLHHKDDRDIKDVKHGGVPPSGRHLHVPFDNTEKTKCSDHEKRNMEKSVVFSYTVG